MLHLFLWVAGCGERQAYVTEQSGTSGISTQQCRHRGADTDTGPGELPATSGHKRRRARRHHMVGGKAWVMGQCCTCICGWQGVVSSRRVSASRVLPLVSAHSNVWHRGAHSNSGLGRATCRQHLQGKTRQKAPHGRWEGLGDCRMLHLHA